MLIITPNVLPRQIQKFKKKIQPATNQRPITLAAVKSLLFPYVHYFDGWAIDILLSTFYAKRRRRRFFFRGCQEKNFFPPEKKKKSDGGPQKNNKRGGQYIVVQIWLVTSWHRTQHANEKNRKKADLVPPSVSSTSAAAAAPKTIKKEQFFILIPFFQRSVYIGKRIHTIGKN